MQTSADDRPVHVVERVREQFETFTVGPGEVDRGAAHDEGLDPRRLQLGDEPGPLFGRDRDGDVMKAPEDLAVLPEVEPGEIEVRQVIAVTDIEEEVGRAPVVPILEELGEGELEEVLVEVDSPFDIAREQGEVMKTPGRRGRTFT